MVVIRASRCLAFLSSCIKEESSLARVVECTRLTCFRTRIPHRIARTCLTLASCIIKNWLIAAACNFLTISSHTVPCVSGWARW